MKENFEKTILPNGIRVLTERIPAFRSATLGIWADVGSADEDESCRGVSHFLEHVFFKGTPSRTAHEIAQIMDGIGGNLNAFTEKEQTCFTAKVMDKHVPIAMELLGDMLLQSNFPEEEIEKEKGVVLEEIKMYEDAPDELIFDLVAEATWEHHPLGQPILGSAAQVKKIERQKLFTFIQDHYTPDKIVFSAAGRIKHDEIVKLISEHFPFPAGPNGKRTHREPPHFKTTRIVKHKNIEQVHFCLALEGIPQRDDRRYPLMILDTILGGSASSRLFQEIREKLGLAYNISSFHGAYTQSALFGIYGASSPDALQTVTARLLEILNEIREKGVSGKELKAAKEHLKGAFSLSLESASNRMIRMAKNEFFFNRFIPYQEILKKIQSIELDEVRSVSREVLKLESATWAVIGPIKGEIDFGKEPS